MQGIIDLNIASDIVDLERLAQTKDVLKVKNPQVIEKVMKNIYTEISKSSLNQEKCYILCLRYRHAVNRLCQIGDRKFVMIKYEHELSRVEDKIEELRPILISRYEEHRRKKQKESIIYVQPETPASNYVNGDSPLFSSEFISAKQLYEAIINKMNILVVDIRPTNEFEESKIKFENIINVPEDVLGPGLSANVIQTKLKDDAQNIWNKRDSYLIIVFLDWNSSSENVTSTKLSFLKASITEWDINRNYKQAPVILDGGFRGFLESYPISVSNVNVNFVRHNEDIDELLELENISYPEENTGVMQLKHFTIQELEDSVNNEESEEEPEELPKKINNIEEIEKKNIEKDIDIGPKGGGSAVDKMPSDITKDETTPDIIRNKIEEHRMRLLNEARNKKNKMVGGKAKGSEGDSSGSESKTKLPPPIRRETKPKKPMQVFGGWCGLVNIKNTCYMNTVLQCLKCIPIIRSILLANFVNHVTRRPPEIILEFASVVRALCEGTEYDKKVYRPTSFYDVVCKLDPVYKKGNHEDCMEFFLFLLNHLNDDCAQDITTKVMSEREKSWYSHLQGRTSFWVDLFYHQFQCTKICQVCHLQAVSYETDNTLMLSVPYRATLRMVHLKELIHEYMEDNQILDYKCSRCQNMKVINRKNIIVEPEILVIVLKRYYQDEYQETRKNNVCVNFDLSFQFGKCFYKLYSVAQHRGTMDHGHYYGHGILSDNTWAEFNDERTTRFEKDWDSIRGSVCAFFYCKENRNTSKM
ncbi:ubiquitin carboxyl-terminal hydrolase 8-like [Sitophilus oryzae]|uniref:ubiquitinyl hydrolase 1 n=1 Tax=Sitophilus oryzae TaxID=7048 RepID=A0A6J2YEY1_SITOR|nr:ubiquitin carboxyl-terminal hydrolase 8-like [Sitophilus oryzae]